MTRERRIAAAALVSSLTDVLWAVDKSPAATSTPPHGPLLHALSVWMVAQAPRQPRDEREHCEQLARHLRDIAEGVGAALRPDRAARLTRKRSSRAMKMPHDRPDTDHPETHREWRWQWRCRHCGHCWATTHGAAASACPGCAGRHDGVQESSQLIELGADGVETIVHHKPHLKGV